MIVVPRTREMQIPSDTQEQPDGHKSIPYERLDGWKEIGAYLRRSPRCAQRWERMEGLPVLRHRHAKGATVYAYQHEVDQWWWGRRTGSC